MQQHIYDVAGIGIGPYNLGLAALMDQKGEVDGIFLIRRRSLPGTRAC